MNKSSLNLNLMVAQMCKGDSIPHIPPLVMASSWIKLGVFGFLLTRHENKCRTNASMIFALHASFYACLSPNAGDINTTYHSYFEYRKNPNPPPF